MNTDLVVSNFLSKNMIDSFYVNCGKMWYGERYFVAEYAINDIRDGLPSLAIYDKYNKLLHGVCAYQYFYNTLEYNPYIYVEHLATSGKYKNVGRMLMKIIFETAMNDGSEVRLHSSPEAMGFYENIGMNLISSNEYHCSYNNLINLIKLNDITIQELISL